MADRATFVTYKLTRGHREVVMVYATDNEATNAAAGDSNLFAQTGAVNSDVKPGDFITATGSLLSAPPADVRNEREKVDYKSQIQTEFIAWMNRRPDWLTTQGGLGDTDHQHSMLGAEKQIFMLAALGDQIIEGNYLSGQSRTNRNSFIEHIVKAIADDYREAFDRLFTAAKSVREGWSGVNVADGQVIHSNIITSTLGTPKDPDTSNTTITGVTIPTKFDPSQDNLRIP